VLGDAVNSPRFNAVATVSVIGVSVLALLVVGQTVIGWLHLG
jgi:hypothetical protein